MQFTGEESEIGDNGTLLSASIIVEKIRTGSISPLEVISRALKRLKEFEKTNMFINVQKEEVLKTRSEEITSILKNGDIDKYLLAGVPVSIKDNIDTSDLPTTGGTLAFQNWTPKYDAPVVKCLRAAGAVVLGKNNMHEYGMGITSCNPIYGIVKNPYDYELFSGGNSGGSAVAVATGVTSIALGSDTGGSIRISAALCGCIGFRPTVGRYPGEGIMKISCIRDTIGVNANSVSDVILIDSILSDIKKEGNEEEIEKGKDKTLNRKTIRIGIPKQYFYENLDKGLESVVEQSLETLEASDITLVYTNILENIDKLSEACGFPVLSYEVLREVSTYIYQHEGCTVSVRDFVEKIMGTFEKRFFVTQLSPETSTPKEIYRQILLEHIPAIQTAYKQYFEENKLDALLIPTTPLPALHTDIGMTLELNGSEYPTYPTFIRNTNPSCCAELPAISLPVGFVAFSSLPVGMELVGPTGSDQRLLLIAKELEKIFQYKSRIQL